MHLLPWQVNSFTIEPSGKPLRINTSPWVRKIHWRRDRLPTPEFLGFPCGSAGKESTCNAEDLVFNPWVGKMPWRRARLPTPVFWPGEFHGLYRAGHDWVTFTSPNSYVETWYSWWNEEVGPLRGDHCPYERDPREIPCSFCPVRTHRRQSSMRNQASTRHQIFQHFGLGLSASRTMRNKFLLSLSHHLMTFLLQQPPKMSQLVHLLSRVWLFVTPWAAASQAFLSITNSRRPRYLSTVILPKPSPPAPSNHQSVFCLCAFTYSGNFT